ncbi:MAG: AhpC/TSA family protein [Candidatus Sumerlaeia bacterium]|nr:AhpC/TSA family protein [Candidatus Sumerlaeia bacterium]
MIIKKSLLLIGGILFTASIATASGEAKENEKMENKERNVVHETANDVLPLKVGDDIPKTVIVRDDAGNDVRLAEKLEGKKTVLIFFRGGWCPLCNVHLADLARHQGHLKEAGVEIVAISPDSPASIRSHKEDQPSIGYTLLSDSRHHAMKAFGIAFSVDDEMNETLNGYGLDLAAASGNPTLVLPAPSVFVVDSKGSITFAHVDPDYRVRLSGEEVLAAAGVEAGDE